MLNGCSQCERQKISDGEKHSSLAIKYCKRYRECWTWWFELNYFEDN